MFFSICCSKNVFSSNIDDCQNSFEAFFCQQHLFQNCAYRNLLFSKLVSELVVFTSGCSHVFENSFLQFSTCFILFVRSTSCQNKHFVTKTDIIDLLLFTIGFPEFSDVHQIRNTCLFSQISYLCIPPACLCLGMCVHKQILYCNIWIHCA